MTTNDYTEIAYKNGYAAGLKDGVKWHSAEECLPDKDGEYLVWLGWCYMVLPYSTKWRGFNVRSEYSERTAAEYKIDAVMWAELPTVPTASNDRKEKDR